MQISERTSRTALDHFCQAVMKIYGPEFLRKPTVTDTEKLYLDHEEKHGFSGMLGIDCTDWEWFGCLYAFKSQYVRRDHGPNPFILLEAVASASLSQFPPLESTIGKQTVQPTGVTMEMNKVGTDVDKLGNTSSYVIEYGVQAESTNKNGDGAVGNEFGPTSYSNVAHTEPTSPKNGREKDASVHEVNDRMKNFLYAYFIGKQLAFLIAEWLVRNNWDKYGFKKVTMVKGFFFFFKFSSTDGVDSVLRDGPWMIYGIPIFLNKWSPSVSLLKEELSRVPVWVKFHDVPLVAYTSNGLSLIATKSVDCPKAPPNRAVKDKGKGPTSRDNDEDVESLIIEEVTTASKATTTGTQEEGQSPTP
nr:hypothetical protein [Tanacetum cinerariifolium]